MLIPFIPLSLVTIKGHGATDYSKGLEPESAPLLVLDLWEISAGYMISKLAGIGKFIGYCCLSWPD